MRRRPILTVLSCLVVLLMLLVSACTSEDAPAFGEPVAAQGPLPLLEGPVLGSDRALAPEDHRGKVVVVNFWATWCTPCREEQPQLIRTWREYRDRGVTFIGVNEREGEAAATDWVRTYDVPYPSLSDPEGAYPADFGFTGLPATFIADREGQLRYKILGGLTASTLGRVLDEVLAGEGEPVSA
ncbi:MAG: TlpA disulfide reductase family protein [Actinomycetota bacterium]